MTNWLEQICGPGFMPHGACYQWSTPLIALHAISDVLIALAYFSIPAALLVFVRRRKDLPYRPIFVLFGAFIVACGLTHVMEVVTIWHGFYYLSGALKAVTAAISIGTAVALWGALPEALRIVGPTELRRLNESLERRVHERTMALESANQALHQEIDERERGRAEISRLNTLLSRRIAELQALFESLPVGVGIADDAECRTVRSNPALARMLGIPPEHNASLSAPSDQLPTTFTVQQKGRILEPAELPMQRCLREGQPVLNFEETIVRNDGEQIAALANAVPIRNADGELVGCVAVIQDITSVLRARAATARLAAIVESSEDAIIGKDLGGTITDWNRGATHIFGYTAEEMIGQSIKRIIPEKLWADEDRIMAEVRLGRSVPAFETVRLHRSGRKIDLSICVSPILGDYGQVIGAAKLARDLTAVRQAESARRTIDRKLQETQKLESLGVLAGGIAHDFNNLLTGILGNASLARLDLPGSHSALNYIDQIEASSRRAADLCRQMLAYSGRGRFVVAPLNLNELVTDTTHLLTISISKNCVLRFNLAAQLPAVSADATQIRQVIMNLVINASEAIGSRSGIIAIGTGVARVDAQYLATLRHNHGVAPGDYAFIEVSDTGAGMDAATLERIFDPFFSTKFTGRGLGLAAVLGIVRGHHGALKIYSEPGRGTTFKLFLPCDATAEVPTMLPTTVEPIPVAMQGRVLVVDDEETVRAVVARILEKDGFTVEQADNGRDALVKFREAPTSYRLVLLDLTMPHLDGEETFRQLRQIQPGIRVILMSGFNEDEAVSRFTGKGLAGFVQKPFEVGALKETVHRVALDS